MDEATYKRLAKRLHASLQPHLGPAFRHSHALDLVAAVVGVRDFKEVRNRPDILATASLSFDSVGRLCRRIEERYSYRLDPQILLTDLTTGDSTVYSHPVYTIGVPKTWICDVCGETIDNPEIGYVIWKQEAGEPFHSFKIIHQSGCDFDDHDCSMALSDFLGLEGLNVALSYLSPGPGKLRFEHGPRSSVPNLDEFVDFIRRVQIPYYDQARVRFNNPKFIDDFGHSEVSVFNPASMKRIAEDSSYS